jgi:pimeloyl-ACP methyl ester carboxylesterase
VRTEQVEVEYGNGRILISANRRNSGEHLLVLLHGFGCAKECFDQAFEIKELEQVSILAPDFPGHGCSSRPGRPWYSLQAYADIVNMVVNDVAPSRVSFLGHSMGGAVGVVCSQARRDLHCLISADGNLVSRDCGMVSRGIARQSPGHFSKFGFGQFLRSLESSEQRSNTQWAGWCRLADPSCLHEVAQSLVEWSDSGKLLDLFASLERPVYICGDSDPKDYLLPELRNVSVRTISKSGHFMMLDNPLEFYSVVGDVLSHS